MPLIESDSSLGRVLVSLRKKRQDILESFVYVPNPEPFQHGVMVGKVKMIDEVMKELVSEERGIEE